MPVQIVNQGKLTCKFVASFVKLDFQWVWSHTFGLVTVDKDTVEGYLELLLDGNDVVDSIALWL